MGTDALGFTLAMFVIGFTIASYMFKKGVLAFLSAGMWIVTAIFCFQQSAETWDIYMALGFLSIAMVLTCTFSPLAWRETTPSGETPEDPDISDMRQEIEAWNRERSQYQFLYSGKGPRRKKTRFEQIGED